MIELFILAFTQNTLVQPQFDNIQVVGEISFPRQEIQLTTNPAPSVSFDEANGDY